MSLTFAAMLIVAPGFAHGGCNHPRDNTEGDVCFLAQFPCEYAFFGGDKAPDYKKALACFEASKSWPFVALMYFNGDGAARDLAKAEAALKAWHQDNPDAFKTYPPWLSQTPATVLRTAIDKCQRGGQGSCQRIDYCATLVEGTLNDEMCLTVEEIRAEAKLRQSITDIKGTLSPRDGALLDRVFGAFEAYDMAESGREYDTFGEGTGRGGGGLEQGAFVRDNFQTLLTDTIEKRGLKAADANTSGAAEKELGGIYRCDLHKTVAYWRDELKDPGLKDEAGDLRSDIADYQRDARRSQREWLKLRDSYAALASSLYQDRAKMPDPVSSAKLAATELRIADLRSNNAREDPQYAC